MAPVARPQRGASVLLRPVATLALLFGVMWLTSQVAAASYEDGRLAVLVGFVLLAASAAGALASAVGLPRLTGFILVGIVVGPSLLGLLPEPAVGDLRLIDSFALALIAMLAGGELQLETLRPQGRVILMTTLFVTAVVWAGMVVAVLVVSPWVPFLAEMSMKGTIAVALLLGIWSANSSPDLTVAVIEERRAKGELVDVILGVTIVKDVVVIVLFTLTLALVTPLLDPAETSSSHELVVLAREVGGALLLGAGMGWAFSQYLGGDETDPRSPFATFLFAYVLVVLTEELHVELLLAGVSAGFVIENLSPAGDRMIAGIRSVAVVIFAFFFAIAGASLDLGAVARFGLVAVVLLLVRVALTRWATIKGARFAGAGPLVQERAWQGLISQGGVSLGLILMIEGKFPELGAGVVALAMAVILGNILGGPVLLGQALAAAGGKSREGPEVLD
jgi:Kef-type K+ transport system membrane component KefB